MLTKMADQTVKSSKSLQKDSVKKEFPCVYDGCTSVFKKPAHLLRHELIHSDERPYTCSFTDCGKSFRSPCHAKRHETTHTGDKNFRCEYEGCEFASCNEWSLKRHIKRTHCGSFKCAKCDREFKKNKHLQQHISMEHKTSTVCCEFPGCGLIFRVPAKMRHHMKVHALKGYSCQVTGCSMKFQLWSECRLHAAQCKNKEKKCDVCGKVFTERSNLKAHLKIHSEEREVFQCTYDGCGRFYTKQSNLRVHVQSYHQNIRPFVCPKSYCKKSFHFQHLLRRHLEYHAKNDENKDEPTAPKRKRPQRMITSTIAGITGYIPELWNKMTPEEMEAYTRQEETGSSYADTDPIIHDNETTQAEMTPVTSGDLEPLITNSSPQGSLNAVSLNVSQDTRSADGKSSEETLTAMTGMEVSEDDEPVIFEPMKSLEEACAYLNRVNTLKRNFATPSSSNSSRNASAGSGEDVERLAKWDQLKSMVNQRREAMNPSPTVLESCHMQSVTESDSSDSGEMKKKVQLIMQRCAS